MNLFGYTYKIYDIGYKTEMTSKECNSGDPLETPGSLYRGPPSNENTIFKKMCMPNIKFKSVQCSFTMNVIGGLRSGELVDQFIILLHSSPREVMDIRAVWPPALSCYKMNASLIAPACGLPIGSRISLRCLAAVRPPLANTCRLYDHPIVGPISVRTMMSPNRTGIGGQCYSLRNALRGVSTGFPQITCQFGAFLCGSLARASLARSQFGAFLFGVMPVWRVSLWRVSHFCTYVDPVCNILFLPVWLELLWRVLCVYVSFMCRIVCVVSLLMLSKCRRGYIITNVEISKVFFCSWSIRPNHLGST